MPESPAEGRRRVVIEGVSPQIDCGRFPIKRVLGEEVRVEADVFTDGHDQVACVLLVAPEGEAVWTEIPMGSTLNDRWRAAFTVERLGGYRFTVEAWVDRFRTWQNEFEKRVEARQDLKLPLREGAALVREAAGRAPAGDADRLRGWAKVMEGDGDLAERAALALDPAFTALVDRYPDRSAARRYPRELRVTVDPVRARFSTWYEMFPRSASGGLRHGTFRDVEGRLPYVAAMGFDVLYLPPIHPIGVTRRKGPNNALQVGPEDVGSPWAVGSAEGGHKAVDPRLGTPEDFRSLVAAARKSGIEIALDIALQCSPDHPYLTEHPEWFRTLPDGSVRHAENPPKKYEDIVPFDFETPDWRALWEELLSIFLHWVGEGVTVFRVDNPHTKAFAFWEWAIARVKERCPEAIFLAEAFTRPKVMYRLAKLGFTQSYTYFAWRNTKWEIERYFGELTRTEASEFFRPNLWPNTPDILTEYLQFGGRPAFMSRLVLAATLGASYGIYGPAFELQEARPREPGTEEYLDSEKYQLRSWNPDDPGSLSEFVARVNRVRAENPALRTDRTLRFHPVDNEQLLCFSKSSDADANLVLTVVNLDPHFKQSGWVELPLEELGVDAARPFQMHDLLSGSRFLWNGTRNYIELDPVTHPAQVFRVRRRVRREQDFDYYL